MIANAISPLSVLGSARNFCGGIPRLIVGSAFCAFPLGLEMAGEAVAKERFTTTDHWSFQAVKRPKDSSGKEVGKLHAIDDFLLKKLKEKGLAPSAPADRRTFIRRLFLVMHGLPPTPEEVSHYLADEAADATERLVDQVLASPHYGERWARHWLDVVRYADSNGFETNRERKTAWPYRDYVIAAFNNDKPYDLFIKEQLAGDALGEDAATGFLVAGPYDIVKSPDITLSLTQREDELADIVNTTGTAFMGLTMGCARCHNHKFDPILQRDFYSMQAVFAGVHHGERPWRNPESDRELTTLRQAIADQESALAVYQKKAASATGPGVLRSPINAKLNEEEFPAVDAVAVRFTISATNSGAACIDELEVFDDTGRNVALASSGATASASGSLPGYAIHKLEHLNDGLTGNDNSWIAGDDDVSQVTIRFASPASIHRIVWGRDRTGGFSDRVPVRYLIETSTGDDRWTMVTSSDDREPFTGKEDPEAFLRRLSDADSAAARLLMSGLNDARQQAAKLSGESQIWAGVFSQPGDTHRKHRGDPTQNREVVAPATLTVMGPLKMALDEPEQQRRLKFAEWVANPANPLTARVMVNRLWHYTFGSGLVDTPSDLGVNGSRPTHPELLDWLADEFMTSGWSVKHMQRLILLSAAFQQSSAPREDGLAADAGSRLLWRYAPRRIEAEAIRDSMLAVSGALNPLAGGPGFYLMDVEEENVMHYHVKEKFTPAEFRRMVYQFRIRQTNDGVFGSFDCPDGSQVMPKRSRSNTPLQALNLFNSPFVLQQADLFAGRLKTAAGDNAEAQVAMAYDLAYARPPDEFELRESSALIRELGLPAFCRAIYNTSEFLFVF